MLPGDGLAEVGTAEAFKPRHVVSGNAVPRMLDSALPRLELP